MILPRADPIPYSYCDSKIATKCFCTESHAFSRYFSLKLLINNYENSPTHCIRHRNGNI